MSNPEKDLPLITPREAFTLGGMLLVAVAIFPGTALFEAQMHSMGSDNNKNLTQTEAATTTTVPNGEVVIIPPASQMAGEPQVPTP